MSSDEERRILEREARYNERLSAFLTCMREGHDPFYWEHIAIPFKCCKRCGLAFSWREVGSTLDPNGLKETPYEYQDDRG